jgi:fructose-bisphosphate aldolase class I
MDKQRLEEIAQAIVSPGKGILAADESLPTIKKRFDPIGVASTGIFYSPPRGWRPISAA